MIKKKTESSQIKKTLVKGNKERKRERKKKRETMRNKLLSRNYAGQKTMKKHPINMEGGKISTENSIPSKDVFYK